jgi:uncharacterized protein YbjT (DUF2867 family)
MKMVLAGATGLVGRQVAARLRPGELVLLGRRRFEGADGAEQRIGAVGEWPGLLAGLRVEVAISTLGTTIREAGSQAAFRAVDYDAVMTFAKAAQAAGAWHFVLVSSVGADASASNFYLKTKGEAEDAVRALGFKRLDIFRPGLLRGKREGRPRTGESIMQQLSPITDLLTPAVFDQYRSVDSADVAATIVRAACAGGEGEHIHHNREIVRFAHEGDAVH